MSRINKTRHILRHETCKCECRLTSTVCNSRQVWNEDKCRCEYKEYLVNKMACDKDIFGILATVSANMIYYVEYVNI